MVWALGFHRRPDLGDVALDAGAYGLRRLLPPFGLDFREF